MDNLNSYDKNSGYGECRPLEIACIKNLFKENLVNLEVVDKVELQVQGIDYIATVKDNCGLERKINIDCKLHRYDEPIFVFEYDDDRPNYKGRCWGSCPKKTDLLLWIIPGCNEYHVYTEKAIQAFYNSSEWATFANESFMNVRHYDKAGSYVGQTYNKFLPMNWSELIGIRHMKKVLNMSTYGCYVKHSKVKYDTISGMFKLTK